MRHIVIFSHGFGVRKDARGLFADIASALEAEPIFIDYNTFDEVNRTVTVRPLSEQAEILKAKLSETRKSNPEAKIDIVCHSQGAVVAGLAGLDGFNIRTIVLLAPPMSMDFERMLQNFRSRSGTVIDMMGVSRLARRDGSFTLVPVRYFEERSQIDPIRLYIALASTADLVIVRAQQDEILGGTDFSGVSDVKVIDIDGDHDFTGIYRSGLIKTVKEIIV